MADRPLEAPVDRPVVLLSNRGPVSFRRDGDELVARRGAGGLVSGIGPVVAETGATWIAAAMSDEDREAATGGVVEAAGFRTGLLSIDPTTYRMAYDVVCNATLWFVHHGLFDLARRPRFDHRWPEAWAAYREVNEAFAAAAAEVAPPDAAVLVQDYHLALVGPMLRRARPDLRTVHFSHTPFAGPDGLRVLPDGIAVELLEGMAGHDACGFHTARWADRFRASCEELLGRTPTTAVSPLAPDPDDIAAVAASPACAEELAQLEAVVGDRRLLVRVDRVELSKNLLRGFLAYDDLLERHPEWREHVVFVAFVYPSREGLPEYLAYRQEVESLVRRLLDKWSTPTWTPLVLEISDDFPRSVAALRRCDVLLVNPIRDGLNLVAKEAMLVNERGAALVLSTEAGAWDEIGDAGAIPVNPFDVAGTADALAAALAMDDGERRRRAGALRERVGSRTPADWLADQLTAAG
jgi:trehalose 6-phosphate synthase